MNECRYEQYVLVHSLQTRLPQRRLKEWIKNEWVGWDEE